MAKGYEVPEIEEVQDSNIEDEESQSDTQENVNENQLTLSEIYDKKLTEFGQFAADKLGFENLEARQEKMLSFVTLLDNLLLQDYPDVKNGLRKLLSVIAENQQVFSSGDVFSTFYTLKKLPYGYNIDRFIETVTFFTSLQENIQYASGYVSGRDLAYIFKDWHSEERDKLIMFANSFER